MRLSLSRRRLIAAGAAGATALGIAAFAPIGVGPAAAAGTPTVVTGRDLSEPGIDVSPDGSIYISAIPGLLSSLPGSPSFIYRSADGGTTWTELPQGLKSDLPGGGDVDLAVDANGILSETDLWLGSSTVATSSDRGQTWTAQPLQGIVGQDRQWLAATSGGRVYHVVHQIPTGLWVSRSLDNGLTYPQHILAASVLDQTGCVCPPGNIVAEDGGLLGDKVGGVFATSDGGVGFYRSTNGGLTFTVTRPGPASNADTSTAFPVVADAGNGQLTVVWQAVENNRSTVWLTQSKDFGATWAAPRELVSTGTSLYPWVAARGQHVAVSLYYSSAIATPDTVPASAQWFETLLTSTDGGATFSAPTTVDSVPVKTGPVCTAGINCSSNRELGDFQQVAMDLSGTPLVSYVRSLDNASNTEVLFARG